MPRRVTMGLKDSKHIKVQGNPIFQLAQRASCSEVVLAWKSFSQAQKNPRKYDELN